jgi:tetratricopeptide (TPR) repeat protein
VDDLAERGYQAAAKREAEFVLRACWYRDLEVGNVISFAARTAVQEKEYDKAAALYEKAVVGCLRYGASFVEPTAYLAVPQAVPVNRARAALTAGRVDEAVRIAGESLKVMPGSLDIVLAFVPDLDKLGRKKEADELFAGAWAGYEKLCGEFPQSAWGHNAAAWLAANCKRELDAALAHAKKAVELEPATPGYRDTLAEVHFRRGEKAEAVAAMKKCLELEPKNGYYRKQLERFEKGDANTSPDEQ